MSAGKCRIFCPSGTACCRPAKIRPLDDTSRACTAKASVTKTDFFAFQRARSKADCGVTFLRLAAAQAEAKWRCWANLQNTHFSGLTRKNPVFERSVLKYVSIKNRILTPSGQKSRVCVNQPDRLLPPFRVEIHFCLSLLTQPEGNLLKKKGWRQREKTEREKEKNAVLTHLGVKVEFA